MKRILNEIECGRMRVTLTEVRIKGKTTYHLAKLRGLLYLKCVTCSDSDKAISLFNTMSQDLYQPESRV